MKIIGLFIILFSFSHIHAENVKPGAFSITRIHYGGGGDWYSDQSSIPNLLEFIDKNTNLSIDLIEKNRDLIDQYFVTTFPNLINTKITKNNQNEQK